MLNIDVTLLRLLLIVLALISGGVVILAYILAGLVIPKEPDYFSGHGPGGFHGGYGNGGYSSYGGYGQGAGYGSGNNYGPGPGSNYGGPYKNPPYEGGTQSASSNFDSMMDDLEKKALRREIEELKAKLAKYEKGEF